ncbi:MAG TPA: TlpA disulfide reductase family protein [Burkholderiales bacterium]|nr:TlpA disulfide reductase family protein [Burkholderiales bacterium]
MNRFILAICVTLASAANAQDFSLTDTQGQTHRLSDYRGKWVLVNFWATWCPPCLEEIPDLVAVFESHKKELEVIGVAMEYRSSKAVTEFADNMFISYPVVLGDDKIAAQIGKVNGLPTSFIFNPDGKLVMRHIGPLNREKIEQILGFKKQPAEESGSYIATRIAVYAGLGI